MTSGNTVERLWKLETSANQLVLEGKREPEELADILQKFVFGSVLPNIDWFQVYQMMVMEKEYVGFAKARSAEVDPNLWTVPVIKGVTCNKVIASLNRLAVSVYTCVGDLDGFVSVNDRDPNKGGSYTVSFSRTIEADVGNKNLSANVLKERKRIGITLLERLLLGLGCFQAARQHLDVKNATLCSGSRDLHGRVPQVRWHADNRRVYVELIAPTDCRGSLRSRSVGGMLDQQ